MHWQDWVIASGSLMMSMALIPSIVGHDKPALSTSLLTGTILALFAIVYSTLNLWFSTLSTSLIGMLWLILAFQKWSQVRAIR
jgi:hypothetical protein